MHKISGHISLPDNVFRMKIYWKIKKKWQVLFSIILKRASRYGDYHWFCQPAVQFLVYKALGWRHISGSWKFLYRGADYRKRLSNN